MSHLLWGGRFEEGLDAHAKVFSYSLTTDARMALQDIAVNYAHANALAKAGVLTQKEVDRLRECLVKLSDQFRRDPSVLLGDDEDIHSCIERLVTERLGDLGKKLHTGKSRNDQVLTDARLWMMEWTHGVLAGLLQIRKQLWHLADANFGVLMPGFTHFQPAQPVLLSHHLLAYYEMFTRDEMRFLEALEEVDACPLGSGALAGNNYGLDREEVARELGFSRVTQNSMDAVADRDFMLVFLSACSICMTHLSRICEEWVVWSSPLFGFITIGDAFTTGSSIMPQKKNPDMAELIRGKSGRVLGDLVGLHHALKGLPLTYNRDLQEDKGLVFDAADTVSHSLHVFSGMLGSLTFHADKMRAALEAGFLNATELADYLVGKGVPFREAHEQTGKVVRYAGEAGKTLQQLSVPEFRQFAPGCEDDVFEALDFQTAVAKKSVLGGTAPESVRDQLNRIQEALNDGG